MEQTSRIKTWIKEQAPMLAHLYENKYVGMAYDRFASLPPVQQKQLILSFIGVVSGSIGLYLLISYISLWNLNSRIKGASVMSAHLQQYQKIKRDKSLELASLDSNAALAAPGQLKAKLLDIGRVTGISPRMMEANEKSEMAARSDESKASTELKIKGASVSLQKITIRQLVAFLKNVESGQYKLTVTGLRIKNDEQLRGYMNVDFDVMAYLFSPEEG